MSGVAPATPFAQRVERAALLLTATGIASSATVRYFAQGGADPRPIAVGYTFYLGLVLLAVPRRVPPFATPLAFLLTALTDLFATSDAGGDPIGFSLYALAISFAYLISERTYRPLIVAGFALWTPVQRFFGPDPTQGDYPVYVALATVVALLAFVALALPRARLEPMERLRRKGIGLLAIASVAAVSQRHQVVQSLLVAPDDVGALVVSVALPLLAIAPLRGRVKDSLVAGLALALFAFVGIALIVGKSYHVDAVANVHHAAELALAGRDPYPGFDSLEALARFGLPPELATKLDDGTFLRTLNYPALSFLSVMPFVAAGLTDIRWVYLGEIFVFMLILIRAVRVPWWPIAVAAVVGNLVITRQQILAGIDPLWALLVAVAWILLERRWASSVALGLAAADRQPAWFVAPFYLALVWRRNGRREALRRAGIMGAAFAVPNLPFFIADPAAFVDGIFAPMFGALEANGVGLVRFGLYGPLPLLPRSAYAALALLALALLLALLWRRWRDVPHGALAFPSIPLYFAWRSLQNYFAFAAIFTLIADEEFLVRAPEETSAASAASASSMPAPSASGGAPSVRAP